MKQQKEGSGSIGSFHQELPVGTWRGEGEGGTLPVQLTEPLRSFPVHLHPCSTCLGGGQGETEGVFVDMSKAQR